VRPQVATRWLEQAVDERCENDEADDAIEFEHLLAKIPPGR